MSLLARFLHALATPGTYDLRHNPEAWFGLVWGLPVPLFSLSLDCYLIGIDGRTLLDILGEHPWHLAFLAHPPLFAIIFGAMGTLRRETESRNRELIDRLAVQAATDSLTGAHNRRFVLEELDKALARAERSGEPVAVVMLDMDNFKAVNDVEGHLAGDKLLQDVAGALRDSLRRGDTLGRYGGDEFLIVAPGNREGAVTVADRAREAVKERTGHTISAGIALSVEDGKTAKELIGRADLMLSSRKKERKTARLTPDR
jgi:diguanylate cyclase (GGDEF)-like protein